jgi:hypothetical protein
MSRQPTCGPAEARTRAAVARRYLEVAELTADEDNAPAWRNVAVGNAVLAGIAASDALCCARLGRRSRDADHRAAVDLLAELDQSLGRDLDRLLQVKDHRPLRHHPHLRRESPQLPALRPPPRRGSGNHRPHLISEGRAGGTHVDQAWAKPD